MLTFIRLEEVAEFRSCLKVDVAVLGCLSLINLTVSVDGKQHSGGGSSQTGLPQEMTVRPHTPSAPQIQWARYRK